MKMKNIFYWGALILFGVQAQVQPVAAGPVPFTIDPTRSSITLSGSIASTQLGTIPFTAQGAGSLTTSYTGSVLANLTPPAIQFPSGSLIQANTNGSWKPLVGGGSGKAPADYGAEAIESEVITGYFADRNLQFDVASPQATLTNGGFNADLVTISCLTNPPPAPETDYSITIPLEPSKDTNGTLEMTGSSTNDPNTAYFTNSGGQLALFFPVSFTNVSTKSGFTVTRILKGMVVATAPASAWPLSLSASFQNGQISLTWPSFPGPTFTVLSTQVLGSPWTAASGVTTVQANTSTWTGSATNTALFYRLQATF
jgi:hypothetical protein